jgi:hypothetical protein
MAMMPGVRREECSPRRAVSLHEENASCKHNARIETELAMETTRVVEAWREI